MPLPNLIPMTPDLQIYSYMMVSQVFDMDLETADGFAGSLGTPGMKMVQWCNALILNAFVSDHFAIRRDWDNGN